MFRFRGHRIRPLQVLALHSPDDLPGEFPAQVRILSERFLHPAVSGIPGQIHHRAERFMYAIRPRLRRDTPAHLLPQFWFKRPGQCDLLGEAGGLFVKEAVQRFFAEQERNAQPGLFHGIALQSVGQGRRTAPQLHASHAHIPHRLLHCIPVEFLHPSFGADPGEIEDEKLIRLPDLLLCRHPGQQIRHPFLHAERMIPIPIHGFFSSSELFFILSYHRHPGKKIRFFYGNI